MCAVSSNNVELIDTIFNEEGDDVLDVKAAPRGGQNGSTLMMAVAKCFWTKFDGIVDWISAIKSIVASSKEGEKKRRGKLEIKLKKRYSFNLLSPGLLAYMYAVGRLDI